MRNIFKKSLFYISAITSVFIGSMVSAADIDVGLTKTASVSQVVPGGSITYTLDISNLTDNAVSTSTIKDFISNKNIDLLSTTFTYENPNDSCKVTRDPDPLVALFQGDYIYCDIAEMLPNTSHKITYTVPVKDNAVIGESVKNSATITTEGENASEQSNNRSNTSTEIVSTVNTPTSDISLTKSVDKTEIASGETVEYTLVYKNTGALNAEEVLIKDLFDVNFNPDSFELVSPTNGVCKVTKDPDPLVAVFQNGEIECNIGTITDNAEHIIKYKLTTKPNLADGTQLKNIATISSSNESAGSSTENN